MIDTQAIRSKILDLAMRGQLTEQYENEVLDYDAFHLTGNEPFSIPCNWKWAKIETIIAKDVGGGTPSKSISEYWDNGSIPWMSVKDFSSAQNGVLEDTTDHITQAGLDNSSSNLVDENAIIICMRMALGKIVKIKRPMAINQDLRAIWVKPFVDNDFFVYFYSTLKVDGHGMTVVGMNKKQLMNYLMPIPPLAEQKRIVKKIDQAFSVLDTIDKLQAQYADNLTALKSKLIDAAIQGKLTKQLPEDGTAEELYQQIQEEKQRLIKEGKIKKSKPLPAITEDEIPFDIPENWKWIKLGNIANVLGGKRIPAGRTLTTENTGHKYIRISDMKNGTVNTEGLLFVPEDIYPSISQYIINKDDIYITVAGTIGKVGKIPAEIDGANLTENADRIVFSIIDQDWLIVCLSSTVVQKQIERLTTSVAQPKLAIKRIQAFSIPLPPLAEQKRIVQKLDEILKLCERMY